MRFEQYLITEANLFKVIKDLIKLPANKIKQVLQSSWKEFTDIMKEAGQEEMAKNSLEKSLFKAGIGINIRSLDHIGRAKVNESEINEARANPQKGGFVNWLKSLIFQGTIGASIFTSLQSFFELEKILQGQTSDPKRLLIYAFLWVLLATKAYKDWKKDQAKEI